MSETKVYNSAFEFYNEVNHDTFGANVCVISGGRVTDECEKGATVWEAIAKIMAARAKYFTVEVGNEK